MVLKFSRRVPLRVVGPSDAVDPVDEAAAFYDRTITAAWRLALRLYDQDERRAGDAVVDAYRAAWLAGPAHRDQAWLLHALVAGTRDSLDPVPA